MNTWEIKIPAFVTDKREYPKEKSNSLKHILAWGCRKVKKNTLRLASMYISLVGMLLSILTLMESYFGLIPFGAFGAYFLAFIYANREVL